MRGARGGAGVRAAVRPAPCLALLVLCLALGWPAGLGAARDASSVVRVIDGDTCLLEDGRRFRLAGLDAPETAHDGAPAQYYASEAASLLARLTLGQPVRLLLVGEGRDRFGRVLGDLTLPDGASVGERLLERGAVYFFWHPDVPQAMVDRYVAAERRAMAAGVGFWPRLLALPVPTMPYVGNAASRRFHDARCPDAGRVNFRNRVVLPTLAEAFARGYAPARNCTPWPTAGEMGPAIAPSGK